MSESPDQAWARCRPYIEAALATCHTHTIEDVEAGIEAGLFQFWPGRNCAAVTEICTYPRRRALHHWLSGGDLHELVRQSFSMESWATLNGCTAIYGTSADRPGLRRVLSRLGYEVGQIEYNKDLT